MRNLLLVCVLDAQGGLPYHFTGSVNGNLLARGLQVLLDSGQRIALDVVHYQVRRAILYVGVMSGDDIWMRQRADGSDLAFEALSLIHI